MLNDSEGCTQIEDNEDGRYSRIRCKEKSIYDFNDGCFKLIKYFVLLHHELQLIENVLASAVVQHCGEMWVCTRKESELWMFSSSVTHAHLILPKSAITDGAEPV